MAIAIQPTFPVPDRTKQPIRSTKDEYGVMDIGWCDGVLSDGRPFRAETWAQDQITETNFFFSSIGLEDLSASAMKRFVEQEGLVSFREDCPDYCCSAGIFTDDGENRLWSVNIIVGDEEHSYVANSIPIFPYSKVGEPNTMFNSIPIKAAQAA